jgi:hypothetical protein
VKVGWLVRTDDAFFCLFTDRKSLERFHGDKYKPAGQRQRVAVWTFNRAGDLREFLVANESQFEGQGCRHIAVNPARGMPPMYAPIRDFVEYLQIGD